MAAIHYPKVMNIEVIEVFKNVEDEPGVVAVKLDGVDNFITVKQAEELCEKLQKTLYEEQTYKELNELCNRLYNENQMLREALAQRNELEGVS